MNIQWRDSNSKESQVEWLDFPPPDVDYYELLEVSRKASPEVIKRAYRILAERYHPDKHPTNRKRWAEEMMKSVNVAYSVLADDTKRREYDAHQSSHART
jgi:DnaJ-class molecular chaperone